MKKVLVTGTAGFIGFHLAKLLLKEGFEVIGYDGMTDYYDVSIKERRHEILSQSDRFRCKVGMLEDFETLSALCDETQPDVIVHLAAQAGVRYSLENPRAYTDSNLVGTFNILECARRLKVEHLLMASTSSVYGANTDMPFHENQACDTPLTYYAATKKANESMGHSYAHIYDLPVTMFRFFTVYGPYGRPDLALFKFVRAALNGEAIDVYNHGNMARDFTYVDDLVYGIRKLIDAVPAQAEGRDAAAALPNDSLSPAAPYRVVNIGNSDKVKLMDFILEIEKKLGMEIKKNMLPMQLGDVPATWADAGLLQNLTDFRPNTPVSEGISAFVDWYREYYGV
ncbi:NAD-dependent epimerase/dehydratase family protein [Ferrimonas balearica]|uniref:NAD-dependent epimerase/dehydratase family protein n=1 Tax=Ferrimonas balearica TaxID=44012 RepID=UPI001C968FA9|nr:NAD-dependent epimerase/dehydratase family protein [Ferrimonas balearica]MBY5981233.1 GDP-mannose 4,6-dehydratase [Ferrimonas balearica]